MAEEKSKYFVVKKKAVPEVLLKVVEAKKLLESERALTVQDATERVGISRSSFYKYKDDIFPFYDNTKGKTVTFVVQTVSYTHLDVYKRQIWISFVRVSAFRLTAREIRLLSIR